MCFDLALSPSFFLSSFFLSFSLTRRNLYFTEVWHDHTFHMTVPGSQAHAHVSGLRPAVSYQFRIYAENELGRSQASDVSISRFNTISSLSNQTSPAVSFLPQASASRFIREIDTRASKRHTPPRIAIFSLVEFHAVLIVLSVIKIPILRIVRSKGGGNEK